MHTSTEFPNFIPFHKQYCSICGESWWDTHTCNKNTIKYKERINVLENELYKTRLISLLVKIRNWDGLDIITDGSNLRKEIDNLLNGNT